MNIQQAITNQIRASIRTEPVRKVQRLKVAVHFRPDCEYFVKTVSTGQEIRIPLGFQGPAPKVACGQRIKPDADTQGKRTGAPTVVEIYADDLPKLEALVESDMTAFKRSEEKYLFKLRDFISTKTGRGPNDKPLPENFADWTDPELRLSMEYTQAAESHLYDDNKGGLRPFARVEVLEELGVPKTEDEKHIEDMVAMFERVSGARSNLSAEDISAIVSQTVAATLAQYGLEPKQVSRPPGRPRKTDEAGQ